jgi:NADPH2:quinone reductase
MADSGTRAWRSSGDGVGRLVLERCPPATPGPREAVIAVRAAALNFSDLLMLEDRYQVRPPRPFTPGQEVAGAVVAAGHQSRLRVGQLVASKVASGGFAEFAVVSDDMAIALPDGADLAIAVALPVSYVTALVALEHCGRLRVGETLLVHAAAGGAGLAAVQLGRALGARVIASAGSPEKRALAATHGADATIDYADPDWVGAVRRLTEDRGVDVIFDPVGGEVAIQSLRCIAWDGRLLIVGFSSGKIPELPANRLLLKRAAAIGVYWSHERDGPMVRAMEAKLVQMLGAGAIRPHVERRMGLEALPQALADLAARRSSGKLVLTFDAPR